MTIDEVTEVIRFLAAAFPTQRTRMSDGDVKGMLAAYTAGLIDLEHARVKVAIANLVKTARWIPTIAEIREAVVDVGHGKRRAGGEAWGDVVAAIRQYGWSRTPGIDFDFGDPVVADVVRAFGWYDLCRSENSIADRARFVELYDRLVARERTEIAIEPGATSKRLPGAPATGGGYRAQISATRSTGEDAKPTPLLPKAGEVFAVCVVCKVFHPPPATGERCARWGMIMCRQCHSCEHVDRHMPDAETGQCSTCGAEANPVQYWRCNLEHVQDGGPCNDPACYARKDTPA